MNSLGTHISNLMGPAEVKLSRKEHIRNYVMLYLLMAQSSMPFFVGDEFLIGNAAFSLIAFAVTRQTVDRFILGYSYVFLAIFCLQFLFFGVDEINVVLGYMLRIVYAYTTIKVIGRHLIRYYINILYFFTIVSFLFFIPSLFIREPMQAFFEMISEWITPFQLNPPGRTHILIYTFGLDYSSNNITGMADVIPRNSGPFWEPGGFGVFLTLAIVFELLRTKRLFTRKNIIFCIALVTTLSTGSFIALFLLITFYLLSNPTFVRIIGIIAFVIISCIIYFNTFFLSQKINQTLDRTEGVSLNYAPRTRFVSTQLDLIDFFNNPLLGRGRFQSTRFDTVETGEDIIMNHRTNSVSNMLVEFGIIGFVTFFYTMYLSFKQICLYYNYRKIFAACLILVMFALGSYEMIYIKPFFIGLSFMFLATGHQQFKQKNNTTSVELKH